MVIYFLHHHYPSGFSFHNVVLQIVSHSYAFIALFWFLFPLWWNRKNTVRRISLYLNPFFCFRDCNASAQSIKLSYQRYGTMDMYKPFVRNQVYSSELFFQVWCWSYCGRCIYIFFLRSSFPDWSHISVASLFRNCRWTPRSVSIAFLMGD